MSTDVIKVSEPFVDDVEAQLVAQAMTRGDISGLAGDFIGRFEAGFAEFVGCRFAVTASSGTTALQLALAALDVRSGDEVLVSTLTNMATFFAVMHQGAVATPIDIEPDTYNLDPNLLEAKITPRTKGILVVHLFGHPVDMGPVCAIARRHGLWVVEDCAEAHGAEYRGIRVGHLGRIGCFSFYGNKIITTGEGGMCTTDDELLANKMRSLKSLAFGRHLKFMHEAVGYNYRMTNVQAAIGCGQLTKIHRIIQRKRTLAQMYHERLHTIDSLQLPVEKDYALNVYWMYHVGLVRQATGHRQEIMTALADHGIETREGFIPANLQHIFLRDGLVREDECPCANRVAYSTFYLPSGVSLTESQVDQVCETLTDIMTSI